MKTKKLIFKILLGFISIALFALYVLVLYPKVFQWIIPWSSFTWDWEIVFYIPTGVILFFLLLFWLLALSDEELFETNTISLKNFGKKLFSSAPILVFFVIGLGYHFFFPYLVLDTAPSFLYLGASLVLTLNILALAYLAFRQWQKIGNIGITKKAKTKKVVLDEVKKPLPKEVDKKKILFISDLSEDNTLYQLVRNSSRNYVLIRYTAKNIPSNLSEFSLVIVHYVAGIKLSKELLEMKKIVIPTNTTKIHFVPPPKSTVFYPKKSVPLEVLIKKVIESKN